MLLAGIQQEIVFFSPFFFYSRKAQKLPFSVTMGKHCFVPHRATFPRPCVLCPFQCFFWTKRTLPTRAGWIQPSWPLVLGWNLCPAALSGAALSGGMGLCIPRMFWTMNWFYWFLSHCWFVFPVSINRPEEQHHSSCWNVEISVISQKSLCIDPPPSALGFFSFYPFLGSFPDFQKSRNLSRLKDSVAILPHKKEHFPVSSCFPSLLPCPFQRRRLEVGFLLSLFKCLQVDSVELSCLGWNYFIDTKMKLLKAFVGLEKSWIWVLVCKTFYVAPRLQPGNHRNKLIKLT